MSRNFASVRPSKLPGRSGSAPLARGGRYVPWVLALGALDFGVLRIVTDRRAPRWMVAKQLIDGCQRVFSSPSQMRAVHSLNASKDDTSTFAVWQQTRERSGWRTAVPHRSLD